MEAGTHAAVAARTGIRTVLADYFELTKPRSSRCCCCTTITTMYVAGDPSLALVVLTCLGGALSAGGAGAINHWYDRDLDARMERTANRPVPSGRVSPAGGAQLRHRARDRQRSCCWRLTVNLLAAALALSGLLGYVFIYTIWLKRSTPQNIVIGGAAGAVPPLVAWAAVTGSIEGAALYLFAIVFYWTPPHFWALSLLMKDEYAKAGVPMLPVVRGEDETRWQIVLYTMLLIAVSVLPFAGQLFDGFYLAAAVGLGGASSGARADPAPACGPPLGAAALPLLARLPRPAVHRDGRRS